MRTAKHAMLFQCLGRALGDEKPRQMASFILKMPLRLWYSTIDKNHVGGAFLAVNSVGMSWFKERRVGYVAIT
jgi:hypothetical protein